MLKLYNTLTRIKEEFRPIEDDKVKMYTCGLTVYDYGHIGNFRTFVSGDMLKKYLKYKGYNVLHVMNVTDVDDNTIDGANKAGINLGEYTKKYTDAFFEDAKTLNIEIADINPKATEHIDGMIELIEQLSEKGLAYERDGSVYYRISRFKNYGRLSKLDLSSAPTDSRVDTDKYEKENVRDFVLWKAKKEGEPHWDTPFGPGRPGWHIECSAMSMKYLGKTFDIHLGGKDLIFPHHENEIAQSEGATGEPFVKYWIHCEFLLIDGRKMSKSEGNFYTLRDLLKKRYDPMAIRYLLLSVNYRSELNFTEAGLVRAEESLNRLRDFTLRIENVKTTAEFDNLGLSKSAEDARINFEDAMDDDLNTSKALGSIFELVRITNTAIDNNEISHRNLAEVKNLMIRFNGVLDILDFAEETLDVNIRKLIEEREEARRNKDYELADRIRGDILMKGFSLEDTNDGVRWKKVR